MKKSFIFWAVLSLIIVVTTASVWTVRAGVTSEVFVAPSMYTAKASGEVFTVNINISNVQNLRAFEFKLGYNATLLSATQVVQGSFLPPPPKSTINILGINQTAGYVWLRITLASTEPTKNGSGTLATITFKVTLAPAQAASCTLSLYNISLYDASMLPIAYDSSDGLYFWKSLQPDPPLNGRVLDLSTQKGGIGQGVFGGNFALGETVELIVNLTYNGFPVSAKLVAFEVTNPQGNVSLGQAAFTDSQGIATINFTIPSFNESVGTWTVFSTAEVADVVVFDFLSFNVTTVPHIPVGGYTVSFEKQTEATPIMPYFAFSLIVTVPASYAAFRRKKPNRK